MVSREGRAVACGVRAKAGLCLKKQSWPAGGGGRNPPPPILSLSLGVLAQVMVSQDQEVLETPPQ